MRVDRQKHGGASVNKPKLKPSDTGGADLVVGTIEEVVLVPADGEYRERFKFTFAEFRDRHHYLRAEEVDIMCDAFGENTDEWRGVRVPLLKGTAPNPSEGNKEVPVYRIAPEEQHKKLLAEFERAAGGKRGRSRR